MRNLRFRLADQASGPTTSERTKRRAYFSVVDILGVVRPTLAFLSRTALSDARNATAAVAAGARPGTGEIHESSPDRRVLTSRQHPHRDCRVAGAMRTSSRAIRVPATVEEEQCRARCSGRSRLAQVARSSSLAGQRVERCVAPAGILLRGSGGLRSIRSEVSGSLDGFRSAPNR